VTGELHFQVHPCAVKELLIDPLPEGASRDGALYPDGARLTNLKEARDLLYKMQRPAIAPNVRPSCFFKKSLFLSHLAHASLSLVGVPARLERKGPRVVPQSWRAAHGRWRVQAGPSARVPSVQPCRLGRTCGTCAGGREAVRMRLTACRAGWLACVDVNVMWNLLPVFVVCMYISTCASQLVSSLFSVPVGLK
jgi:hypothetical protein